MLHREWFSVSFLHLPLLFSVLVYGSDPKPNADTLIHQSKGKWTGQLPNGDTTEFVHAGQIPKGPELTPDYGQNDSMPAPSSNIGGSILNLVIDLGKPSKKEQAKAVAEKLAEQDAKFMQDVALHGVNTVSQYNLTDRQKALLDRKIQRDMEEQFKAYAKSGTTTFTSETVFKAETSVATPVTNTVAAATQVAQATTAVTQAVAQTPATQIPFQTTIQNMLDQNRKMNAMMDLTKKVTTVPAFTPGNGNPPMVPSFDSVKEAPPSSGPGFLQTIGSGVAGAYGLAKGGAAAIIGGAKAGAAATAAAVKGAGAYVATVAAANPVGAVVVGGVVVIGGGYLIYKSYAGKTVVEAIAHREIHNHHTPEPTHIEQPKIQLVEKTNIKPVEINKISGDPRANRPKSELRHFEQTGNPRDRGIKPYTIKKKGQGDTPHGYKDEWGHFADFNPKTEGKSFECFENGTYHGRNQDGIHVFTMTCPETGGQLWVHALDNGGINNSGINITHMPIDPVHGLPYQPKDFVKPKGPGHGVKLKQATIIGGISALTNSTSSAAGESYLSLAPRYNEPLQLPDAPEDVTPEKAARRAAKVRANIENVLNQYEDEVFGGKPYSPEVRAEVRGQGREILAKHLSDEL